MDEVVKCRLQGRLAAACGQRCEVWGLGIELSSGWKREEARSHPSAAA